MLHQASVLQEENEEDDGDESGDKHTGEGVNPVNGAEPVYINGHQPVPGSHHQGEGKADDEDGRSTDAFVVVLGTTFSIFFQGELAHDGVEQNPDSEDQHEANQEEGHVQVTGFSGDDAVVVGVTHFGYAFGHPVVDMTHARNEQQHQHKTNGEEGTKCFGYTLESDSPAGIGDILQGHDKETDDGDPDEIDIVQEDIGPEAFQPGGTMMTVLAVAVVSFGMGGMGFGTFSMGFRSGVAFSCMCFSGRCGFCSFRSGSGSFTFFFGILRGSCQCSRGRGLNHRGMMFSMNVVSGIFTSPGQENAQGCDHHSGNDEGNERFFQFIVEGKVFDFEFSMMMSHDLALCL